MKRWLHKVLFVVIFILSTYSIGYGITINVDAYREIGKIPKLFSASVWISNLNDTREYIYKKHFLDHRPSTIQLTLSDVLRNSNSFEGFKERLYRYFNSEVGSFLIQKVKQYNTRLVVGFEPGGMPPWLSSRAGDKRQRAKGGGTIEMTSPPKDTRLWGNVVRYTVDFLYHKLGVKNLGFYVGHEPNAHEWTGNEESFFRYYEAAAKAVKQVNDEIVVGGIGVWHIDARKLGCNEPGITDAARDICRTEGDWQGNQPMTKSFIEYVANKSVPLDFINWHSFGGIPQKFLKVAETIRGWLRGAGIDDKKVRLYPSDWSYWGGPYTADYLDMQETAAYIAQALYYMWKAGIDWHGHDFDVANYDMEKPSKSIRNNSTFIGDWSVFTWGGAVGGGITKPMYNAFKALSMLSREDKSGPCKLITTEFQEEETLTVISTLTGDRRKLSLMVTNFIPKDEKRFKEYILHKVEAQTNFIAEEIKLIRKCMKESKGRGEKRNVFLQCKNRLISTLKDPKKIEGINFIGKAYLCLNSKKSLNCVLNTFKDLKYPESRKIADTIRNIMDDSRKAKQVQIHFTNIPFDGKARLITYTIDSTHSNACSVNKRTEPTKTNTPCGIGGIIDQAVWEAKEKAKKEGVKVAEGYLFSLGYTSHQVAFFLKDGVETCRKRGNMKECLNSLIMTNSYRFTYPPDKIKNDLKEAFKRYKEAYHASYYNSVDKINNLKEVSLEGSEKIKVIDIVGNRYTLYLNMEPNSIWLVALGKEER